MQRIYPRYQKAGRRTSKRSWTSSAPTAAITASTPFACSTVRCRRCSSQQAVPLPKLCLLTSENKACAQIHGSFLLPAIAHVRRGQTIKHHSLRRLRPRRRPIEPLRLDLSGRPRQVNGAQARQQTAPQPCPGNGYGGPASQDRICARGGVNARGEARFGADTAVGATKNVGQRRRLYTDRQLGCLLSTMSVLRFAIRLLQ